MVKETFKLAIIGFFVGMAVGNMILIITSITGGGGTIDFSGNLIRLGGSTAGALALENIFSGLHGAICMAGVILYRLDNWSMTRVVITHYLIIMASFLLIGGMLGWYSMEPLTILCAAALMAVGYFIVWIIMYIRYNIEVGNLNKMIKKGQTK